MTVKDLIDKLSTIDPEASICVSRYSSTTDGTITKTYSINSVSFETRIYSDKNEIRAFIEIN